jgi:hypothetical protein
VWLLINEQCHAHFRDLCPAHNKMSVPPTYLPPKRISLNFCGLKKKLWKCLLHGKQSNNSEEKNNAPKFEMHLWGFFLQTIYNTPLLNFSILTNYYYTTKCTTVSNLTVFDRKLFGSNKKDMLERFYEYAKLFCPNFLWKSVKFFMKFRPRFLEPVMSWIFSRHLVSDKKKMGKFVSFSDTKKVH